MTLEQISHKKLIVILVIFSIGDCLFDYSHFNLKKNHNLLYIDMTKNTSIGHIKTFTLF